MVVRSLGYLCLQYLSCSYPLHRNVNYVSEMFQQWISRKHQTFFHPLSDRTPLASLSLVYWVPPESTAHLLWVSTAGSVALQSVHLSICDMMVTAETLTMILKSSKLVACCWIKSLSWGIEGQNLQKPRSSLIQQARMYSETAWMRGWNER
mgnify:CR=1 FL=1